MHGNVVVCTLPSHDKLYICHLSGLHVVFVLAFFLYAYLLYRTLHLSTRHIHCACVCCVCVLLYTQTNQRELWCDMWYVTLINTTVTSSKRNKVSLNRKTKKWEDFFHNINTIFNHINTLRSGSFLLNTRYKLFLSVQDISLLEH